MTTKGAVVMNTIIASDFMVVASFNRGRAKDVVQIVPIWLLVDPVSDGVEHIALDLYMLLPKGWVVKDPHYVIHNLFY